MGEDVALGRLLTHDPDEWRATWAYALALATFRQEGANVAAARATGSAARGCRCVCFRTAFTVICSGY